MGIFDSTKGTPYQFPDSLPVVNDISVQGKWKIPIIKYIQECITRRGVYNCNLAENKLMWAKL